MRTPKSKRLKPKAKLRPLTKGEWELKSGHPSLRIAGVDEVGRGCLAGPVVAAAVVLRPDAFIAPPKWVRRVTDSKLLSPEARAELAPQIREWVWVWAIGSASVEEIDEINIYHASHLAMCRAVNEVHAQLLALEMALAGLFDSASAGSTPSTSGSSRGLHHVLVDGNVIPRALGFPATAIIQGDSRALSIACGSILAKVHRDQQMTELDSVYPGYEFSAHKGYGTPAHQRALAKLGASPIHRRSFGPVAEVIR